ncbi:MAG: polymerase subunit delta, partial [Bacteroidota bacterium]
MAKTTTSTSVSLEALFKDLQSRKFAPIYMLCGEEPYYIDQISNWIENNVLTADEREFNQTVMYGLDVTADDVMATAKRYPMMSEYQVVIVKEAQQLKDVDALVPYLKSPQTSTILVFCNKGKEPDKRKEFYKALQKEGVYYVADRVKQEKMPEWIGKYFSKKGYRISAGAAVLLAESVGNELEKVENEASKMFLNIPAGNEINEQDVERYVGISREFNVFEFQKALGTRNVFKANQIAMNIAG